MKLRNSIIIFSFILFAIVGLVVCFTAGGERLEQPAFWLSFVISVPLNFIALGAFACWGFSKSGTDYMRLPVAFYLSSGFTALTLLVGIIFMYAPVKQAIWPLIVFGIIILAYAAATTFSIIGIGYMESTEKEIKEKRLFIKMLEADVRDCLAKAATPEVREALEVFAENVKFSDPMSHASLAGVENTLSSLVAEISADLTVDSEADVLAKVARAEALLSNRNNRCLMLK